jgi:WD40 repeat protein
MDDSVQPTDSSVSAIAFSSDGRLIAHTGDAGQAMLHDIITGAELLNHSLGTGWAVSFLPGDKLVAYGGRFEGIAVFDVATGKLIRNFSGSNTPSLAVSPDGEWLASGHLNGTTRLTDLQGSRRPRVMAGHRGFVDSIVFSPDGKRIISSDRHAAFQFTDVDSGEIIGRLPVADAPEFHDNGYNEIHCTGGHVIFITTDLERFVSNVCLWPTSKQPN